MGCGASRVAADPSKPLAAAHFHGRNRLAALVRGEEAALPTERSARCVAETGGGQGITVGPNFDAAFVDPENGKPAFAIEPHADGTTAKVAWIQGYLDRFAPDQGIVFEAGAPRNAEG